MSVQKEKYNAFVALRNKDVIQILDGDVSFGTEEVNGLLIEISMPYLSGPDLCNMSSNFGLPMEYNWGGGNLSRWQYLDALLEHCIKDGRVAELLCFLFSKEQFLSKLRGLSKTSIEKVYKNIVSTVIDQINGILYFNGIEIVYSNSVFTMRSLRKVEEPSLAIPSVETIDMQYISEISKRAMDEVESGYFDGAITKSRTLLEEVFIYVIEKANVKPSESGKINDLYKQVKTIYNMHPDKNMDVRINELLSGLEKILSSISKMKNENSDSHGRGEKRIKISDHHARLFVNSSVVMSEFVLEVFEKSKYCQKVL